MYTTGNIDTDSKVKDAIHHIRGLTEWAKIDWLQRTGKPLRTLGTDGAERGECEWHMAWLWVCAKEYGGTTEDADNYYLRGLAHAAILLDSGFINASGELLAA